MKNELKKLHEEYCSKSWNNEKDFYAIQLKKLSESKSENDEMRLEAISFLEMNDTNGDFSDEDSKAQDLPPITKEQILDIIKTTVEG